MNQNPETPSAVPNCPCCHKSDRVVKSDHPEYGEFFCPCNEPGRQYFNHDGSGTLLTTKDGKPVAVHVDFEGGMHFQYRQSTPSAVPDVKKKKRNSLYYGAYADFSETLKKEAVAESVAEKNLEEPGAASGLRDVQGPMTLREIKTAPRDGSDILGFVFDAEGKFQGADVFSWGGWDEDNGKRYWGWKYESGHLDPKEPTHWLPLPTLAPSVPEGLKSSDA